MTVQLIVRITFATIVTEHVGVAVCLEVQDNGVMNNAQPIVSNAISLIRRIVHFVKMTFMVRLAKVSATKIANHGMELMNA